MIHAYLWHIMMLYKYAFFLYDESNICLNLLPITKHFWLSILSCNEINSIGIFIFYSD